MYSEADRESLHVRFADDDVCIGPPPARDSYLKIPRIIAAAEITGADAIHPGYGFLAENAEFAETCQASNITFIGPTPEQIRMMGDKAAARKAMTDVGVPIIPGTPGPVEDSDEALGFAREIGFPVIIKAAAGGGGKGMRVANERRGLRAIVSARALRGAVRVRQRRRLRREVSRASAPHRVPDPGRPARQRDSPRRARLLGAAPPPEADRGGAESRGDAGPAHSGWATRR